jgi:Hypoxia induced protein conserved region
MNWFFALVLIGLLIMVVVSLVRGIIAFLQTTKLDLENEVDSERMAQMQVRQNQMMFARIKYQALAIVVVVILLAVNR